MNSPLADWNAYPSLCSKRVSGQGPRKGAWPVSLSFLSGFGIHGRHDRFDLMLFVRQLRAYTPAI